MSNIEQALLDSIKQELDEAYKQGFADGKNSILRPITQQEMDDEAIRDDACKKKKKESMISSGERPASSHSHEFHGCGAVKASPLRVKAADSVSVGDGGERPATSHSQPSIKIDGGHSPSIETSDEVRDRVGCAGELSPDTMAKSSQDVKQAARKGYRYASCTAPIGEYCSKHGVTHKKKVTR
jgi:hypothetical protein